MPPAMASTDDGRAVQATTKDAGSQRLRRRGGNPLGEIIEQMMRQAGGQAPAPQPANPMDNPFGKVLQDMFGGGAQQPQSQRSRRRAYGDNPLGRSSSRWGAVVLARARGSRRRSSGSAAGDVNCGGSQEPGRRLFGKMCSRWLQQRDEYQKGMESIFDTFAGDGSAVDRPSARSPENAGPGGPRAGAGGDPAGSELKTFGRLNPLDTSEQLQPPCGHVLDRPDAIAAISRRIPSRPNGTPMATWRSAGQVISASSASGISPRREERRFFKRVNTAMALATRVATAPRWRELSRWRNTAVMSISFRVADDQAGGAGNSRRSGSLLVVMPLYKNRGGARSAHAFHLVRTMPI
jgi:hypothetical protein